MQMLYYDVFSWGDDPEEQQYFLKEIADKTCNCAVHFAIDRFIAEKH